MDQFRQPGRGRPRPQEPCGTGERKREAWAPNLEGLPLAMAYVPRQCWNTIYEAEKAICRGTAFPELDLPFEC